MSTNDPFSENRSPFGRTRNQEPEQKETPTSPFPSFPKPTGGTIPAPTKPVLPTKPSFPQTANPIPAAPSFLETSTRPGRGTTEDLFPELEPVEETYAEDEVEEENTFFEEETVESWYEEIYGEPLEEDESSYPILDDEEQDILARRRAAADLDAAGPTLFALADDEDPITRVFVASNENAPTLILDKLAKDPETMVREAVMENPNCSTVTYTNFVNDPDMIIVGEWVQQNRTTSEMVAPLLTTDDPYVAEILLQSSLTPASAKTRLRSVAE